MVLPFTYLEVVIFVDHLCVFDSRGNGTFLQTVGWEWTKREILFIIEGRLWGFCDGHISMLS